MDWLALGLSLVGGSSAWMVLCGSPFVIIDPAPNLMMLGLLFASKWQAFKPFTLSKFAEPLSLIIVAFYYAGQRQAVKAVFFGMVFMSAGLYFLEIGLPEDMSL